MHTLVHDTAQLNTLCKGDAYIAGDFYVGLFNQTLDKSAVLSDVTTEPVAGTGGYARKVVERSALGWPTIETVNGIVRAVSKVVTFSAVGADFTQPYTRMFLCDVASGTVGNLLAVSGPLDVAVLITDGLSKQHQFIWYKR